VWPDRVNDDNRHRATRSSQKKRSGVANVLNCELLNEARAIACGRTPTGEHGFGARLTHDISSGKAAEAEKVR
jgi:hypothetical protein